MSWGLTRTPAKLALVSALRTLPQEQREKAAQVALYHAYQALRHTAVLVAEGTHADDTVLPVALRRIEVHINGIQLNGIRLETLENVFALVFMRRGVSEGASDASAGDRHARGDPTSASGDAFVVSPRVCKRLLVLVKDGATSLAAALPLATQAAPASGSPRQRVERLLATVGEALWRLQAVLSDVSATPNVAKVRTRSFKPH